jgi:hypothetical protein
MQNPEIKQALKNLIEESILNINTMDKIAMEIVEDIDEMIKLKDIHPSDYIMLLERINTILEAKITSIIYQN